MSLVPICNLLILTTLLLFSPILYTQTLLFEEDWIGESGTFGNGVDENGNSISWDVSSSSGVSYSGGALNFSDTDMDVIWFVSVPGGTCEEAEVSFDISESGDLEGFCSLGSVTCDCNDPVGGFANSDYVDVFIDGNHLSSASCSIGCSATNCPGSCDPSGGYTLSGDCSGGTVDDDDWGVETFFETVFNNGNDIDIEIIARNGTTDEEISIGTVLVECFVLPIELNYFSVTPSEESVHLKWETLSEINNAYFSLERSTDGIHFIEIGQLNGAGTTFKKREYDFFDETPQLGMNYYRIKQFNFDGQYSQSEVKVIEFEDVSKISTLWIYPNPAKEFINISLYPDDQLRVNFEILDITGQVVQTIREVNDTEGSFKLSINHLNSGSYLLRSQQGSIVRTGHFVIN